MDSKIQTRRGQFSRNVKRCIYTLLFGLIISIQPGSVHAQQVKKLVFDSSDNFKIVQFTDTHINLPKKSNLAVFSIVENILKEEKPDIAVFTGDIVTQNNPQEAYYKLSEILNNYKIPWVVVFGNHDSEHNLARAELAGFLKKLPYCMNGDKKETYGNSNFVLEIEDNKGQCQALLYCMDSNSYSTLKPNVNGYGWFDFSQIDWYKNKSKKYAHKNGGEPLPALAFFHIPLPEYTDAWNNKEIAPIGVKNEDECSPDINTGMFAAMLESGDVMGTFVGHDHINDYIGVHYGIALAYGRVSKVMKSKEDPLAGARVIQLKRGQRSFETWIRDMNGKKELECSWPASFTKKQE